MKQKSFALVGSWDWDGCESSTKGITVCDYDEKTGHLSPMRNYLPEIKIGSEPLVNEHNVYFVEEIKQTRNRKSGGGGYVYYAEIDEKRQLHIKNQKETLACNPCYCALDKTNKYLIVVHYASTRDTATKLKRDKNGDIRQEIIYDDAAIVLFRLHDDGSINKLTDFAYHEPNQEKCSLLHSVYKQPDGNIFVVFDKGLDRVYTYKIDYENEKLILLDTLLLDEDSDPRYCVFHPELHKIYSTNEKRTYVYTIGYDPNTGKLKKEKETYLLTCDKAEYDIAMSSDIKITPDFQHLYIAIRGIDIIAVCNIDENGFPHLQQNISCNGKFPRGLGINKKGTILYACNTESDNITLFDIDDNGLLTQKEMCLISRPANITIIEEDI